MTPLLAPLYHAHHTLSQEDLPFWLELAASKPGPILELGCGTGRLLIPLAQQGSEVVGLDNNLEMLIYLLRVLPASLSGQVRVICTDFLHFRLGQKFAMIFLACNTYSTLRADERQVLLLRVRDHLEPGGLFAASLPNPIQLRRLPRRGAPEIEEIFPHPIDGEPVQVSSAWMRTRSEFHLIWYYDHLMPDGKVERQTVETSHQIEDVESYLAELNQAGLETFGLWGDYDRQSWQIDSPYLIFAARLVE